MNYFNELKQAFIIAEIGVNHNGDIELAKKLIDAAKKSGADAVKFQTFSADKLVSPDTPKVRYQEVTTSSNETHYEMIRKLELPLNDHYILKEYCEKIGITFLSTPYDLDSANFLLELGVPFFKTASADLVDLPLHNWIAKTGKPSIVALGMATLGEVERTVNIYRNANNLNLALLHCVSNYPCADKSLNLRVINTLHQAFQLPIGYSDHSVGLEAAVLSISMGARIIEKHFTLDKNLPGPDQIASSTPEEFSALVQSVRRAEVMLGSPIKACQEEEREMAQVSRKSIVLVKSLKEGDLIMSRDLMLKRPGTGLGAEFLEYFVGKTLNKDKPSESLLTLQDVS